MIRSLAVLLCGAALMSGAGAEPIVPDPGTPAYECRRATGPIVVDGKLDEEAWQHAPPTPAFVFPWADLQAGGPRQRTVARLLWDDDCLYVAFECEDSDITAVHTNRDDPTYKDDCVEIFIAPKPDRSRFYFGFEMNARGVLYDYFYAPPEAFITLYDTGGVQVRTQIDGTVNDSTDIDRGWTLEMAIPFANFKGMMPGERPKAGDVWRINLNRWDGTEPHRALSQWSPSGLERPNPHRPEGYGALVFAGEGAGG